MKGVGRGQGHPGLTSFPDASTASQDLERWVGRSFSLPRPLPSRAWLDPRGAILEAPEGLIPRASTAELCPSTRQE